MKKLLIAIGLVCIAIPFSYLLILNPGSVSRPRDDSFGSFMLLYLERGREPEADLFRLED